MLLDYGQYGDDPRGDLYHILQHEGAYD